MQMKKNRKRQKPQEKMNNEINGRKNITFYFSSHSDPSDKNELKNYFVPSSECENNGICMICEESGKTVLWFRCVICG